MATGFHLHDPAAAAQRFAPLLAILGVALLLLLIVGLFKAAL